MALPATRIALTMAAALVLTGCGFGDDGNFDVGFMDSESNLFSTGVRLSESGQHVLGATRSGLVTIDMQGEVVPALADRWNVTEDGSIFVFRLRDGTWPNGQDLSAESVRVALNHAIRELRGTSLGLDLAPVDEVRAMAGRVIEIRLASPMPDLLQLLAQPELGLTNGTGETGPMVLRRDDGAAVLSMRPPLERGLPEMADWRDYTRDIHIHAHSAEDAVERFDNGELDVVLGGRLASLPLADTGPLARGTVRLDPAIGLFGLQVVRAEGLLANAETRAAIAMAIDRPALASAFNVGVWTPTTRLVTPDLPDETGLVSERWGNLDMDERRALARGRIAAARGAGRAVVTLAIGTSPGHQLLFDELRRQLAGVGVTLERAETAAQANLLLVDRVARYASARWFLNQFNCQLDRGLCSSEADLLTGRALDERDDGRRAALLGAAEQALMDANVFIPLGPPLRWSLVRGNVDGFAANVWGFHPLPDMAVIPR